MSRAVLLTLLMLFSMKAFAQRSVTTVTLETNGGLGYSFPYVDLGETLEIPIKDRFMIEPDVSYSYAHKAGLNNGYELGAGVAAEAWINDWFGLATNVSFSRLKNSSYTKSNYLISPGVIFEVKLPGLPSHLSINGLIPSGKIDKNGIESDRVSGAQFNWEALMGNAGPFSVRLNTMFGYYHGYEQGNPECDGTYGPVTCPRTAWNTGNVEVGLSFVFPKDDPNSKVW